MKTLLSVNMRRPDSCVESCSILKLPIFFPSYFLAVGGSTPFKRRYIAASA
jgi:hypothetical protein